MFFLSKYCLYIVINVCGMFRVSLRKRLKFFFDSFCWGELFSFFLDMFQEFSHNKLCKKQRAEKEDLKQQHKNKNGWDVAKPIQIEANGIYTPRWMQKSPFQLYRSVPLLSELGTRIIFFNYRSFRSDKIFNTP